MSLIRLPDELPTLRSPVLIAAFEGWNDAGECATVALDVLADGLVVSELAQVDGEPLFDLQQARPTVRTRQDGGRAIDWPNLELSWARTEGARGDVVLLRGAEPNLRWRSFCSELIDLARVLDVQLVLTVGALQVDVPHTRPVPLTLTAADPELGWDLDLRPSTYEGPTGITGVLHVTAAAAGLPSLSLWAGVPHYLAATPYLRGGLVLVERIAGLIGVDVPLARLARDAAAQTDEITALIEADPELAEYVTELESRTDTAEAEVGEGLPEPEISAEDRVAELERYLRGER